MPATKPFRILRDELIRRIEERRGDPEFMARLAAITEDDADILEALETDSKPLPLFFCEKCNDWIDGLHTDAQLERHHPYYGVRGENA